MGQTDFSDATVWEQAAETHAMSEGKVDEMTSEVKDKAKKLEKDDMEVLCGILLIADRTSTSGFSFRPRGVIFSCQEEESLHGAITNESVRMNESGKGQGKIRG